MLPSCLEIFGTSWDTKEHIWVVNKPPVFFDVPDVGITVHSCLFTSRARISKHSGSVPLPIMNE